MEKNQMVYYSAKQVLNILGISMSTLQRIQNRGEITPEWAGGQRRYSIQEIERYLKENSKKHKERGRNDERI
ncbi:helix-turn-helix domain-containing protein [Anaerovoracaceae bacterium 41-7]